MVRGPALAWSEAAGAWTVPMARAEGEAVAATQSHLAACGAAAPLVPRYAARVALPGLLWAAAVLAAGLAAAAVARLPPLRPLLKVGRWWRGVHACARACGGGWLRQSHLILQLQAPGLPTHRPTQHTRPPAHQQSVFVPLGVRAGLLAADNAAYGAAMDALRVGGVAEDVCVCARVGVAAGCLSEMEVAGGRMLVSGSCVPLLPIFSGCPPPIQVRKLFIVRGRDGNWQPTERVLELTGAWQGATHVRLCGCICVGCEWVGG